jgi:Na+/proline symporter
VALLGKGGAGATLVMIFLAVTSSFNSELIAVSSIVTYDVYRAYINPDARGKKLVWMSHIAMVVYAAVICLVSVGLWYNGISMGYMYLLMGVLISSAVIPATLTLLWKGQNKWAATLSPILGAACAIIAWLVTASKTCGVIDVACTGSNNPMLAGNLTALLSPIIFIPILTLIFGLDKYDWQSMLAIRQADDHDIALEAESSPEAREELERAKEADWVAERKKLDRAFKIASVTTVLLALALLVLWPMPLYGSGYIFSKKFFTGWVIVGIIWIFCTFMTIVIYPLWESRSTLSKVAGAMLGLRKNPPEVMEGEPTFSGSDTPPKTESEEKSGERV